MCVCVCVCVKCGWHRHDDVCMCVCKWSEWVEGEEWVCVGWLSLNPKRPTAGALRLSNHYVTVANEFRRLWSQSLRSNTHEILFTPTRIHKPHTVKTDLVLVAPKRIWLCFNCSDTVYSYTAYLNEALWLKNMLYQIQSLHLLLLTWYLATIVLNLSVCMRHLSSPREAFG